MDEPQPKGYHWIAKEIQKHDPETEYELIWRLMTSYFVSDFITHLVYTLTFPNFIVTEWGAEPVWREDGGKVVHKATKRVEETATSGMVWSYYGPSDPRTRKAADDINKRHAFWAKKYPGNFSHNDDYIYTMAFSAVLSHRLRLRLGLSGFSEKEKIAAHHFWRDMVPLLHAEGQVALHSYPDDWDGLIAFCENYEHQPKPYTHRGSMITLAVYEHFAYRYFPPALRSLGKSIPIALSLETTLDTLKIQPVHPILKRVIVFMLGTLMWLSEILLPDPKSPFLPKIQSRTTEARKARINEFNTIDNGYSQYFTQRHGSNFPSCPFGMKPREQLPGGIEKFT